MPDRRYGTYTVETSNEDKVLFPDAGLTKGDLIDYYEKVAEHMLPHVEKRALVMHRFPDGIDGEDFYQKQTPEYFPDWIDTVRVKKEGGHQTLVVCNNQATLAYLANQACITPHVWLSRADKLDHPDRMVFDLDPPEAENPADQEEAFKTVRFAARACRDVFDELELPSFLKTTGSKGVHLVTPLSRGEDFDTVRAFARDLSKVIAARHPDELTTEVRKNKRKGRLFLDVARNSYAQTAVAPYAVRAIPGAPVATPIEWDELGSVHARSFTMKNVFRRLAQRDDPWKNLRRRARSIDPLREKVQAMLDDVTS